VIDLHAHILPGLDDGPPEMKESLELCRVALRDGIDTIVATPHMLNDLFDVREEDIVSGVAEINRRLEAEKIPVTILPGAEFHITIDLPERFKKQKPLTVDGAGKYLLLELPEDILPQGLDEFLFSLRLMGFTIILSHPERNHEIQSDPSNLDRIVKAGHLVQLTAASIAGGFGEATQNCAFKILKENFCHVVATDCHNLTGRPPILSEARAIVASLAGPEEAEHLFDENPSRILAGKEIERERKKKKARKWFGRLKA
jgi:protein-tyrosine phosphatase